VRLVTSESRSSTCEEAGRRITVGIDEPGGTNHLLDHLRGVGLLVTRPGSPRRTRPWRNLALELLELQRPVVEARMGSRKPYSTSTVLRARFAVEHAAHLRDGDVALVDHDERLARQVVDERGRRFTGSPARQVPGL